MAKPERSLIVEWVRTGLRNARAKGNYIGRPKLFVDRSQIARLRAEGLSWLAIAQRMGVGEGTVRRASQASAKDLVLRPNRPLRVALG